MPMFLQLRQLRGCLNVLARNGVCRRNFSAANQFNLTRMHRDDDRQLWDLLGRTSPPKVSPFFARNVVRQVRGESESARRRMSWPLWRILVPATAATLLALGATIFIHNSPSPSTQPSRPIAVTHNSVPEVSVLRGEAETSRAVSKQPEKAEPDPSEAILAQIDQQDYEVVQNLDDLMVMDETSLWDEDSRL
jgi:hypothetical protein